MATSSAIGHSPTSTQDGVKHPSSRHGGQAKIQSPHLVGEKLTGQAKTQPSSPSKTVSRSAPRTNELRLELQRLSGAYKDREELLVALSSTTKVTDKTIFSLLDGADRACNPSTYLELTVAIREVIEKGSKVGMPAYLLREEQDFIQTCLLVSGKELTESLRTRLATLERMAELLLTPSVERAYLRHFIARLRARLARQPAVPEAVTGFMIKLRHDLETALKDYHSLIPSHDNGSGELELAALRCEISLFGLGWNSANAEEKAKLLPTLEKVGVYRRVKALLRKYPKIEEHALLSWQVLWNCLVSAHLCHGEMVVYDAWQMLTSRYPQFEDLDFIPGPGETSIRQDLDLSNFKPPVNSTRPVSTAK
jgi:hypothetical protein